MKTKHQILKDYDGDEVLFVQQVLIPIFRGLGFEYANNHGPDELGKDVILRKSDALGRAKYTAVVAKVGDISNTSSKAKTTLVDIERQVDQAWKTPFSSATWNEKDKYVSEVYVVTNGNISHAAEAQIIKSLQPYNKENTSYLNIDVLVPLIDKHYPELWAYELPPMSRYLNCVKNFIEQITETDSPEFKVADAITTTCFKRLNETEPITNQNSNTANPLEIVQKNKRVWFQGPTGSGKTYIVKNYTDICLKLLKKEDKKEEVKIGKVPIYARSVWFDSNSQPSLKEIINKSLTYLNFEVADGEIDTWIKNYGICFFIDEFEMHQSVKFINQLDLLIKNQTQDSSIIILSRIMDDNSKKLDFSFETWLLNEINLSQASQAISRAIVSTSPKAKNLYREIIQGSLLERLPRTPLAINILRKVFINLELGKLPNNAYEFFHMYFDITLGRWEQRRDPSQPLDYKQVRALLQSIAYYMVSNAKLTVTLKEISHLAKDLLATTGQSHIDPSEYIIKITTFGEICRVTNGTFEFTQRAFMEFLAGSEIKDHYWDHATIKENFLKYNWEDSIIFAAGGKQKDDKLLSILSAKEVNNFTDRFSKLKNLGLISQALYHSSVAAKVKAINSGASEAIGLRDDKKLAQVLVNKNLKIPEISFSFTTLQMFAMCYGKQSLQSSLESLVGAPDKKNERTAFYILAAYSMLDESMLNMKALENGISKLPSSSSPEGLAFGGYIKARERIMGKGHLRKVIAGKKVKNLAKKTKKIILDSKRTVIPKDWNKRKSR